MLVDSTETRRNTLLGTWYMVIIITMSFKYMKCVACLRLLCSTWSNKVVSSGFLVNHIGGL